MFSGPVPFSGPKLISELENPPGPEPIPEPEPTPGPELISELENIPEPELTIEPEPISGPELTPEPELILQDSSPNRQTFWQACVYPLFLLISM